MKKYILSAIAIVIGMAITGCSKQETDPELTTLEFTVNMRASTKVDWDVDEEGGVSNVPIFQIGDAVSLLSERNHNSKLVVTDVEDGVATLCGYGYVDEIMYAVYPYNCDARYSPCCETITGYSYSRNHYDSDKHKRYPEDAISIARIEDGDGRLNFQNLFSIIALDLSNVALNDITSVSLYSTCPYKIPAGQATIHVGETSTIDFDAFDFNYLHWYVNPCRTQYFEDGFIYLAVPPMEEFEKTLYFSQNNGELTGDKTFYCALEAGKIYKSDWTFEE